MSFPEPAPQVLPPPHPFPRGRFIAYMGIVMTILLMYFIIAEAIYPPLVEHLVKKFVTETTQADVSRTPYVHLTLRGGLILKDAEVTTSQDGDRRPFYRAEEMELLFDVSPLLRKDVKLRRLELRNPEIFIVRGADGIWNLQWVFRPKTQPPVASPGTPPPSIARPPEDRFPMEGIHISHGTIHFIFLSEQKKEMRWKVEDVNFKVTREYGRYKIDRISGNFYGGRMVMDVDVPTIDPMDVNMTFALTGARVDEMVKEGPEATKRVRGTMNGSLSIITNPAETDGKVAAHGKLEIKQGGLWEFPVFYSVLNVLSLKLPGEAVIDESELEFAVERSRIKIKTMNFLGHPLSLFGDGTMDLHGEHLDLTFVPRLGKRGLEEVPVIGKPTQYLFDIAKGVLVPVSVTGSFAKPEVAVTPAKPLTQPVRDLINIFSGKD